MLSHLPVSSRVLLGVAPALVAVATGAVSGGASIVRISGG
ncbi:hypothetical protein KCH_51530 [Kitasatospora cheerisanensis KCTC 2395]|uniref:Uncharacterized protein n=1 Tax=Kitasatospora cheerisanensis KCTC 2395 TaxID=1348663 RepID=A0A066YP24_9ACTN|nr:hypothetical protein KCH_51530 [Kitasatospora cheerisanensis KCTC 2395]